MLFSEENRFIYKIYSNVLVENPDTITIKDDWHSYDDRSLGNITGVMTDSGKFVMSKSLRGHGDLFDAIYSKNLENLQDLTHNCSSLDEIYRISRYDWQKFRVWPKFKIFSFWMSHLNPEYKPVIDDVLNALGDSNHLYKFDLNLDNDQFITYDELMAGELSDQEKEQMAADAKRKEEDQRRLGDALLGNNRRRFVDTDNIPERKPAWMNREGD